jgi:hypothetical protein
VGIIRDNPIFWREVTPRWWRQANTCKRMIVSVLGICSIIIWIVLVIAGDLFIMGHLASIVLFFWSFGSIVVVPIMVMRSLRRERYQRTWDSLVLSRLSLLEIYTGKLFVQIWRVGLIGLVIFPACWLAIVFYDMLEGGYEGNPLVALFARLGFIYPLGIGAIFILLFDQSKITAGQNNARVPFYLSRDGLRRSAVFMTLALSLFLAIIIEAEMPHGAAVDQNRPTGYGIMDMLDVNAADRVLAAPALLGYLALLFTVLYLKFKERSLKPSESK